MSLAPLLSNLIPGALAIAGISKLSPSMQRFVSYAGAAGYGTNQILDYLRENMEGSGYQDKKRQLEQGAAQGTLRPDERALRETMRQGDVGADVLQGGISLATGGIAGALGARGGKEQETQQSQAQSPSQVAQPPFQAQQSTQPPPSPAQAAMQSPQGQQQQANRDPFQEVANYSPDIAEVLKQYIDNGLDPFQAATTIKGHLGKQFGGIINAIEKQEGKNFANWIGSLFGGGQSSRGQQRNVQPQAQQQAAPSAQKEQLLNQMRQMTQFITKGK